MTDREQFLAGDRPDDVCFFLHEAAVSGIDALAGRGERTDRGVVLVVPGDTGREAFQSVTGIDPMGFAQEAMEAEGEVRRDLTGGVCPERDAREPETGHEARLLFAFAEAENEAAGGLYAEGDVIHAYVACECGARYSEKWVAGDS
jgi:hypothetical protein